MMFEHKVNVLKRDNVGLADILLDRNNTYRKVRVNRGNIDTLIEHMKNFAREILNNATHMKNDYNTDLEWTMLKTYTISILFFHYLTMVDDLGKEIGGMLDKIKKEDKGFVVDRSKDMKQFFVGFNREFSNTLGDIKFMPWVPDTKTDYIR